ncbi:MAG: DUF5011 domain-containing protein [Erysipelotrichaceae bacterium]|nr:DUF5011 domain-containing protein [Erysipelotrichaceae bacterium]MDD6093824.1 DUF5011 domain-containing protein [bacterium]MDY3934240.1 DUF5011 domain-containing protein [Bacilli bacterium]
MKRKKKKVRLKIKNILIFLILIIGIILIICNLFKNNLKIEIKNTIINVNSSDELQYTATFKNKDVTNKVKHTNNINKEKLGKYKVTFTYKDKSKEYKVKKKIEVKDIEKPVITLNKGNKLIIPINTKYTEPGYTVTDNYDKSLDKSVKITGNVDTEKEGTYKIKYSVTDKSNNTETVTRTVTVTKETPLNQSVKDFDLNGFFNDVILKETEDGGKKYSDEFIFAGDSTALYYVINKQITGKRLWHKEGIDPETALTSSIYINHIDTKKTFVENFKEKQPEKVIMTLGTNSAAYMEPAYFIKNYKKLLNEIKKVSPNTLIIIQSIPPVAKSYDSKTNTINNDKINKLNYYIAEMCQELKLPFLNSAESLKDSDGGLKDGYYIKDGIHLSKSGNEIMMKYFETHMYKK